MGKILSKNDILNANDIHIEELSVPEWGGVVYVKTLTADERDMLEAAIVEMSANGKPKSLKLEHMRAHLAMLGICDAEGNRLFSSADVKALGKKSAAALDRVVAMIQKMSALTATDIERLMDDLKNGQRAALPTD